MKATEALYVILSMLFNTSTMLLKVLIEML